MKATNTSFLATLILFLLTSCGVKSPPVPPKGTNIPSVLDKYKPTSQENVEEVEKQKEDE